MWLLKSEPETFSWSQMVKEGTTRWDGVRNYQAANHMKQMVLGDLCFFYHSGKDREIVGIVEVVRTHYPDSLDPRFVCVDVRALKPVPQPVTLAAIKAHGGLDHLALVRQSRLSVMPVDQDAWQCLLSMGGIK